MALQGSPMTRTDVVGTGFASAAENDFSAARHGLDARIVDVDERMRPIRELVVEGLDAAGAALAIDDLDRPLTGIEEVLADEPEYTRQCRIGSEQGMGLAPRPRRPHHRSALTRTPIERNRVMATIPSEPVEDPQIALAADPTHGNVPEQEPDTSPDPEKSVGPGVDD